MAEVISKYTSMRPEEYLSDRVEYKIKAYTRKGARYRWSYIVMASAAVIGASVVPVLVNLDGVSKVTTTLVSLLVTVLVGLEGLLHFREHWRSYDLIKSFLRQETNLYRAGAGPYRGMSFVEDAFVLFVERIEEAIAKERSQTIEMRTTVVKQPDAGGIRNQGK